jgi:hypothetical protein
MVAFCVAPFNHPFKPLHSQTFAELNFHWPKINKLHCIKANLESGVIEIYEANYQFKSLVPERSNDSAIDAGVTYLLLAH